MFIGLLIMLTVIALILWAGEGFPALHIIPKRKREDPLAGAKSIAASRAEYVRIEREAMKAWEDACRCPEYVGSWDHLYDIARAGPRRFRNLDGTLGEVMPEDWPFILDRCARSVDIGLCVRKVVEANERFVTDLSRDGANGGRQWQNF